MTPERTSEISASTLPKKQKERERNTRTHKSAERVDYGYPNMDTGYRNGDGYKHTFSRDYDRDSPVRNYNYRTKVLI